MIRDGCVVGSVCRPWSIFAAKSVLTLAIGPTMRRRAKERLAPGLTRIIRGTPWAFEMMETMVEITQSQQRRRLPVEENGPTQYPMDLALGVLT